MLLVKFHKGNNNQCECKIAVLCDHRMQENVVESHKYTNVKSNPIGKVLVFENHNFIINLTF